MLRHELLLKEKRSRDNAFLGVLKHLKKNHLAYILLNSGGNDLIKVRISSEFSSGNIQNITVNVCTSFLKEMKCIVIYCIEGIR